MVGGGFSQHLMRGRPLIGRFIIQKTFFVAGFYGWTV
jgi:hypothetical protein